MSSQEQWVDVSVVNKAGYYPINDRNDQCDQSWRSQQYACCVKVSFESDGWLLNW